jgi:HSP20 family protein
MSNLAQNGRSATSALEPTAAEQAVAIQPRVDVLETENEFLILADVPGVKPEDVDVRFEKGELAFTGRRPAVNEFEATAYQRTFAVSDGVAADRITAELKAGVLKIHLPKIEAVKPKRIAVAS